jgi:Flp pilus assembly protein TadG
VFKPVGLSSINRFRRDEDGGIAVIASLSMAVMLGAVGLSVDYGRAVSQQIAMQRAMDASLLAGAATRDVAARVKVADDFFNANFKNGNPVPITAVFATSASGQLTGKATAHVPTTVAQVIGITSLSTGAAASATPSEVVTTTSTETTSVPGVLPCIFALDPAKRGSFWLISDSDLVAPQCEVHVASTHNEAMIYDSPSDVVFKTIELKGGVKRVGGGTIANIHTASTRVAADPFAGKMPSVPVGACTYTNYVNTTSSGGTTTVSPGTYCGITQFNGNKVTMNPGLYIFKSDVAGGGLKVGAHTIQGHGVSFYFADNNTKLLTYASKNRNHLHAPTTGTYAGILMFEPAGLNKRTVTIDSADEQSWQGLVYLPSIDLRLVSISKWPNRNLEDMPAWPARGSSLLALGEAPATPTMAVSIIVNSLFSDSLSDFHHTPFAWGTPVVYLPGTTVATLTTSTRSTIVPGTLH